MKTLPVSNKNFSSEEMNSLAQLSKLVLANAIRKAVDEVNPPERNINSKPITPIPDKTISIVEELSRHINPAILEYLANQDSIKNSIVEFEISNLEQDISPYEVIEAFKNPTENNLHIREKYRKEYLESLLKILSNEDFGTKSLFEQISDEEQERFFTRELSETALYYLTLYLTSSPENLREDTSIETQDEYEKLYRPKVWSVLYDSLDIAQEGVQDKEDFYKNTQFVKYNGNTFSSQHHKRI